MANLPGTKTRNSYNFLNNTVYCVKLNRNRIPVFQYCHTFELTAIRKQYIRDYVFFQRTTKLLNYNKCIALTLAEGAS